MPEHKRRHDLVFTPQQVEDAENSDIVLITTWELFRLLRGKAVFDWHPDVLKGLFYGKGRISCIPLHWKLIGHIAHFYDNAGVVSIELSDTLRIGDRIGFLLSEYYVEENVTSIQIDKNSVKQAMSGDRVGHKTSQAKHEMKAGMPVYAVFQMLVRL